MSDGREVARMPKYSVNAWVTHNHTIIAKNEDEAYEDGQDEAARALRIYFDLSESVEVDVFEDVNDLGTPPGYDDEPDDGQALYLLTAALPFHFEIEAVDEAEAEGRAETLLRAEAEDEYGLRGISSEDIVVFTPMEE